MAEDIELIASSIAALGQDFEVAAHNLANISTTGYKRLRSCFHSQLESLLAGMEQAAGATAGGVQSEISVDFSQGDLIRTGRPLDLAIEGPGFFIIETPEGPLYGRNGSFRTNANGQLVDAEGRTVAGEAGPIVIPPAVSHLNVRISRDGTVSAGTSRLGRLRLVEFGDTSRLESVGGSCFRPTEPTTPAAAVATTVHQGYQEASNVPAVRELIRLILISRLYEANIKSAQTVDEQMKYLLQVAMGS